MFICESKLLYNIMEIFCLKINSSLQMTGVKKQRKKILGPMRRMRMNKNLPNIRNYICWRSSIKCCEVKEDTNKKVFLWYPPANIKVRMTPPPDLYFMFSLLLMKKYFLKGFRGFQPNPLFSGSTTKKISVYVNLK